MIVNMDEMRRNLARAYNKMIDAYQEITGSEWKPFYDKPGFEKLKNGLDEMRMFIGSLMCCYSENPEDLMTDLSSEAAKLSSASSDDEESHKFPGY